MIDMPIVIPGGIVDAIQNWTITESIPDVTKPVAIIREIWDVQTFQGLQNGLAAVPDDVINEALTAALDDSKKVQNLQIQSLGDNKIRITALIPKSGHVVFTAKIEQFEHDRNHSLIKMKMVERKLPDKPLLSWIFSRVSLAMVTKLVGPMAPGAGLAVDIKGNEVTVDFHQALYESKLGSAELFGYRLLDGLVITQAIPQPGYVDFRTSLDLPDNITTMIRNVLQ